MNRPPSISIFPALFSLLFTWSFTSPSGAQIFENIQYTILDDYPEDPMDADLSSVPGIDPGAVTVGSWSPYDKYAALLLDGSYSTGVFKGFSGAGYRVTWEHDSEVEILGILYYPYDDQTPVGSFLARTPGSADSGGSTGIVGWFKEDFLFDPEGDLYTTERGVFYPGPVLITFDPVTTSEMTLMPGNQHGGDVNPDVYPHSELRLLYDRKRPCPESSNLAYRLQRDGGGTQIVLPGSEILFEPGQSYAISYQIDLGVMEPSEVALYVNGQDTGEESLSSFAPKDGDWINYELFFPRTCLPMAMEPLTFKAAEVPCENPPAWHPTGTYNGGDRVSNNGIAFEARTYLLSCGDCGGPGFEQQWAVLESCGTIDCGLYPVWNAHDLFGPIDAIVFHQGKLYQAKQNEQIGLRPDDDGLAWAWEDLSLKGVVCASSDPAKGRSTKGRPSAR